MHEMNYTLLLSDLSCAASNVHGATAAARTPMRPVAKRVPVVAEGAKNTGAVAAVLPVPAATQAWEGACMLYFTSMLPESSRQSFPASITNEAISVVPLISI